MTAHAHRADRDGIPNHTLDGLNHYRALHGVPDLVWNNTMALYASSVSNTCDYPSGVSPYKQHFLMGTNTTVEAIEKWYSTGSFYDYSIDPSTSTYFGNLAPAFTQLIWKSATQVGCAAVDCTLDEDHVLPGVYLTCEYDIGNELGEFEANVLPPIFYANESA
ncbi:extracellular scp domain protein [Phlyctema vagabunda]|uniref:Extracellular scp domain protein n=1 Tax=Phlyctema vagabunda TaxID=108571 RepID=A0ABR4PVV8_9HELO